MPGPLVQGFLHSAMTSKNGSGIEICTVPPLQLVRLTANRRFSVPGFKDPVLWENDGGAGELCDHWGRGQSLYPLDSLHQQSTPQPKSVQSQLVPLHMMRQFPCPQIIVACRGSTMSLIKTANMTRSKTAPPQSREFFFMTTSFWHRLLKLI